MCFLTANKNLLVIKTDKNLGPAVIEREKYIRLAYRDHLNDQHTYRKLSEIQAINRIRAVQNILNNFITTYLPGKINEADRKYLLRSLEQYKRKWDDGALPTFAHFYLLAKVHKTPLKTRPIVSVSASITEAIGRWVDKELQDLFTRHRHMFPFFLKSSRELVEDVKNIVVPPTA